MIEVWQPVAKTFAAPGGAALFSNISTVDSTPAMTTFGQTVVSLKVTPQEALSTLQKTLDAAIKS